MDLSGKPKISVIMVDGSFRQSYHAVDFFCRQTIPTDDFELIWVEFYDRVSSELAEKLSRYPNARILTLNKEGMYHSSYCFNAGIMESRAELVFIPDADVVVEEHFLEQALNEHKANEKLVMYFCRAEEPKRKRKSPVDLDHLKKVCVFTNPSNYGGCISVKKNWFLEINGYEQHPIFGSGFHANGLDVYTRFRILGLDIIWHPALFLYHPWHPLNAAGFPAYEVQKIIPNHRLKHSKYLAFQGLDPSRNVDVPPELNGKLDQAKNKYKLDEFFDSWHNLRVDPDKSRQEHLYRPGTTMYRLKKIANHPLLRSVVTRITSDK